MVTALASIACRRATLQVSHRDESRPGIQGVLIVRPNQADVGSRRVAQSQCHRRSSSTVLPTRIGTPVATAVGWVTFVRSRKVPFVEPRSSTSHCPSR